MCDWRELRKFAELLKFEQAQTQIEEKLKLKAFAYIDELEEKLQTSDQQQQQHETAYLLACAHIDELEEQLQAQQCADIGKLEETQL